MAALQQLPAQLTECIERCAAALGDVPRLKAEVTALKQTGDGIAHFASALFELELARQGDVESRLNITELAEVLLVFWSDGSGDELSRLHPALESQWRAVAPMLVQFELRRLEMVLGMCWKHRADPQQLARDLDDLQPEGNRRVEFARCLYHLELARQGVHTSRAEFARRAGLLAEAYQDADFARDLVGTEPGLVQLWADLKPYLDEFFEAMEEQAARAMDGTRKVKMPVAPPADDRPALGDPVPTPPNGEPALSLPTPRGGEPALVADSSPPFLEDDADLDEPRSADVTVRAPIPTEPDPVLERRAPGPPPPPPRIAPAVAPGRHAPSDRPQVPSFASLFSDSPGQATPPPPPSNQTPPGSWVPEADLLVDVAVDGPPPPPPDAVARNKSPSSDDLDIVEAEFEAPPPPPPATTPARGLPAALSAAEEIEVDFEPDEATLNFWDYTFAALQQAPVEGVKPRMLASESRQDRKRLTTWLDGLGPHFAVPEAKAMGALVRLMVAGETKEKSLFGQANPRRKEALQAAFGLLAPTPEAAGKVVEWFVLDGAATEQALLRGLELLYPFLSYCARNALDPLREEAVSAYLEQA